MTRERVCRTPIDLVSRVVQEATAEDHSRWRELGNGRGSGIILHHASTHDPIVYTQNAYTITQCYIGRTTMVKR